MTDEVENGREVVSVIASKLSVSDCVQSRIENSVWVITVYGIV